MSKQHEALFYDSEEEYYEIVIPFIKSGLVNNEFVFWSLPEFIRVEDAKTCLHIFLENLVYFINREQILIQDYKATYMRNGTFSLMEMTVSWKELEKRALEKGFNGVYAIGDGSWALKDHWADFLLYESEVNRVIENHKMKTICTYFKKDIEVSKILDVGKNHQNTIVKQQGAWNRLAPECFHPQI